MSIRLRMIDGLLVALCAARSVAQPGDRYLDDAEHHALAEKFRDDFRSEGYNTTPLSSEETRRRAQGEANNAARTWWDQTYA